MATNRPRVEETMGLAVDGHAVDLTVDSWWATLSPERRETVIGSVYEDDMASGRVFAEMRRLGLIQPGQARRTADATGLRRICWPKHLAADVLRLDAPEVAE